MLFRSGPGLELAWAAVPVAVLCSLLAVVAGHPLPLPAGRYWPSPTVSCLPQTITASLRIAGNSGSPPAGRQEWTKCFRLSLIHILSERTFREDLFYRINLITVKLHSWRERREDIPLLARHFADRQAEVNGLPRTDFSEMCIRDRPITAISAVGQA